MENYSIDYFLVLLDYMIMTGYRNQTKEAGTSSSRQFLSLFIILSMSQVLVRHMISVNDWSPDLGNIKISCSVNNHYGALLFNN